MDPQSTDKVKSLESQLSSSRQARTSLLLFILSICSAMHDAHANCRSMRQTMNMGQAAGLAAAMSLDTDAGARSINIRDLQERLRRVGAVLERPHEIAETAAEAWRRNRSANLTSR